MLVCRAATSPCTGGGGPVRWDSGVAQAEVRVNIIMVSSEVQPFSKSGGLADVLGALPPALARRGHRVATVSPRYANLPLDVHVEDTGIVYGFHAGTTRHDVRFLKVRDQGVEHLLLSSTLFDRAGIYGDVHGTFGDNHLRFSILVRAALEAARRVPLFGAVFGEDVVFHVHDWQAALLPVYLDAIYRPLGLFTRTPSVLTIHNLMHQGRYPASDFADLELPPRLMVPGSALDWHGDMSIMRGGIVFADEVTTVSPTYAREITTPHFGNGLHALLRERRDALTGILNGLDVDTWDPAEDELLPATFDAEDLSGKAVCKAALQEELELPVDPEVPLVISIGRLDPQKGMDLMLESIPWLAQEGAQVVVLGSAHRAHRHYEDRLRALERVWPRHVRAWVGFSERMAHVLEAAADLFMMPSLFEPCGLSQLISLRYGAVPVVRYTGGLADTITNYDPLADTGNGWTFDEAQGWAFREALHWALTTWKEHPDAFDRLRRRGMRQDLSWDAAVPEYEAVYARGIERRRRY